MYGQRVSPVFRKASPDVAKVGDGSP